MPTTETSLTEVLKAQLKTLFDIAHPVGSILQTTDSRVPNDYIPGGEGSKWENIQSTFLYGVSLSDTADSKKVGTRAGSKKHTHGLQKYACANVSFHYSFITAGRTSENVNMDAWASDILVPTSKGDYFQSNEPVNGYMDFTHPENLADKENAIAPSDKQFHADYMKHGIGLSGTTDEADNYPPFYRVVIWKRIS